MSYRTRYETSLGIIMEVINEGADDSLLVRRVDKGSMPVRVSKFYIERNWKKLKDDT